MPLTVKMFVAKSGPAQHPSVELTLPQEFKIVGGGALDDYHYPEPGNMLTACYPRDIHTWVVAGKDHEEASPAPITAYALALYDPNDEWDVVIQQQTSGPAAHPRASATLPPGYVLTGGGACVIYHGCGNMLTASFPASATAWEARAKDHDLPDPSPITAFAIGIKPKSSTVTVVNTIAKVTSQLAAHPGATATLGSDFVLSGGGALDNWSGDGNLLTASMPEGVAAWFASGKDHLHSSPATIAAYAIGIRA